MKHLWLLLAAFAIVAAEPIPPERLATMIDALTRLGPEKVHANPKLAEALGKVIDATRGTPQFVQLIREFVVKGQETGLLEVAAKFPSDEAGVAAAQLILASTNRAAITAAFAGTNAAAIAQSFGNTGDKRAVGWLLPLITNANVQWNHSIAVRKQAVRSLAQFQEGAAQMLALERAGKLSDDLKFTASVELNAVRWPELKAEALKRLPPPAGQNDKPLPPLIELLKMKGDARNGEKVFAREEVGCAKCHVVNGRGIDFGPALSEIGTKLGRDALFESILDPNAGISFGYEAWTVEMKNGDEVFGLVVSDAAVDLAVKLQGGAVNRLKKADIAKRTQSKVSIMPTGLAQTMPLQELVDLVDYLASLKKK